VTHWSREVGPYVWHEYDPERTRTELQAIKSAGHDIVRTHLLWDAFVPTPARVEPARLRDFERLLAAAESMSLRVIPVLFLQTLGRCVMLPGYAIDVGARHSAIRAVQGGVAQPGGPRYVYTDPLMLDVCVRWIDEMLAAFAGHPAIAMWDIGHDPAGGLRPRRIDDLRRWVELIAGRIHERQERCMLSLSADDLVVARAVRPALIAASVDALGVDLSGGALARAGGALEPEAVAFLVQFAQSVAGGAPLVAHVGAHAAIGGDAGADADDKPDVDAMSRRFAAGAIDATISAGCTGVMASMWSGPGPRAATVPPFDRDESLRSSGVIGASGAPTAFGAVWLEQARREHERVAPAPWPPHIDVDDYYANLPDSLNELQAAWRRGSSEHPAMLQ